MGVTIICIFNKQNGGGGLDLCGSGYESWRAVVNEVMNQVFHKTCEISLNS
jgi:hypothetical protein